MENQNHKTYWCIQCNRFSVVPHGNDTIPLCPKHNSKMVDSPTDPRRTEINSPIDNPQRHPSYERGWTPERTDKLLKQTAGLEKLISHIPNSEPIVVISNTEDEDIKSFVTHSLISRNRNKIWTSHPSPRYQWVGKLDPNWQKSYRKALENCSVAIFVCRPDTVPNPATAWELETLQQYNKEVVVYRVNINV